jgi:hypothetical protein
MTKLPKLLAFGVLLALKAHPTGNAATPWHTLAPGMELRVLTAKTPSLAGDSKITVLRIDPKLWQLEFMGISRTGEARGHTGREWCEKHKLAAAINAGMFDTDYKTHLGYLAAGDHLNNRRINRYQSVAAFDPRRASLPRFHIFDIDVPGTTIPGILRDYASAVQNLRLVKRPGSNQWGRQGRSWSEAALGEDSAGRILFIFSRSPFSMHDFNRELLAANIGLVAAQHLEGGPEAQLYLRVGQVEMELFGSYETSFREDNSNATPWPVPNVLGVRPRSPD